jgi:hypothetical protein
MTPLERLLTKALISRYSQWEWFRDCTLEKTIILAPDAELAGSLRRCWLPQIQHVLPGCEVRVGQAKESIKTAYRGVSAEPLARRLEEL